MIYLVSVVVAAKEQDRPFRSTIRRMLETHFSVIHVYDQILRAHGRRPPLILADATGFQRIESDDTIIIFKDIDRIDVETIEVNRAVAIVDTSSEHLLPFVASTKLPAITCGLSKKDTITLSSIGTDSAVINIQRSITCFDGGIVEPQEIPVRTGPDESRFALMAATAIFILMGETEQLLSGYTDSKRYTQTH